MRVPAEDAMNLALLCVPESALRNLLGKLQPPGVEAIEVSGKPFAPRINLLQPQEDELPQPRHLEVPDGEAVKLVAVDGEVALAPVGPGIFLVDANPDQMRHDLRQAVIVVAFHPNHFNAALGIGELADKAQKFPVVFGKPAEVQIGKHVTEKDEPTEDRRLQKFQGIRRAADFRAQMQVGNDDRVKTLLHTILVANQD